MNSGKPTDADLDASTEKIVRGLFSVVVTMGLRPKRRFYGDTLIIFQVLFPSYAVRKELARKRLHSSLTGNFATTY
jgi:hypothetical protein